MQEKWKDLQSKYGKPTVQGSVDAYYALRELEGKVKRIDPPHNFQLERGDLVKYIRDSWNLLRPLYTGEVWHVPQDHS